MHKDAAKIRDLNDRFRAGDQGVPGQILCTSGINDLIGANESVAIELITIVRDYAAFTADNDPWGEHDFGSFRFQGETCFWKIDVMDPSMEIAALDPTDPELSWRSMTIMTAQEY